MNILIAPDKFKGTLSASQVCDAVAEGLAGSGLHVRKMPLADGGEGTLNVFVSTGSTLTEVAAHDPLMRPMNAFFARSADGRTAYVEMASASGLWLLDKRDYNPMVTTTYGTGELIRRAIELGVHSVLLGIGGSACNDAGTGMMRALGMRFLDLTGAEVDPNGESLARIHSVDPSGLLSGMERIQFTALTDVTNPFYGPTGAAYVYGPQKGATPEMVKNLDQGLRHLAEVVQRTKGIDLQTIPGTGAGGGIAGGAVAWLNAHLRPGIEVIMDSLNFDEAAAWADVIVTGEGKVDRQTLQGKVVSGVANRALQLGKPLIIVCGQAETVVPWKGAEVFSLVDFAGETNSFADPSSTLRKLVAQRVRAFITRLERNR